MSREPAPARSPAHSSPRSHAYWLAAALVALLGGCGDNGERASTYPSTVSAMMLAQDYVAAWFERHPEQSVVWSLEDPDPDRLTDNSLEAVARWQILQQDMLAQLDAAREPADPAARAAERVLRTLLQDARTDAACRAELRHVDPTGSGWLTRFQLLAPYLLAPPPAAAGVDPPPHGLARMAQMAGYADTEIDNLRDGLREGRLAPMASVRAVAAQFDFLLAQPLAETPFFVGASTAGPEFRSELTSVLREQLMPAFARYRDFLVLEYAPAVEDRGETVFSGENADCLEAIDGHASEGGMALAQLIALVDAHGGNSRQQAH